MCTHKTKTLLRRSDYLYKTNVKVLRNACKEYNWLTMDNIGQKMLQKNKK